MVKKMKPWIIGLIDNLTAVKLLRQTNIESKNGLSLILLDSALEIGFKKYLTYEKKITLDKPVLEHRERLHRVIKKHTNFDSDTWDGINFYYDARCDLYHERSEKTLTDSHQDTFFHLVEKVFNQMFNIDSLSLISKLESILPRIKPININKLKKPIDFFVIAILNSDSQSPLDIRNALEKIGCKKKFSASYIGTYLDRYSHLFYRDKNIIRLSDSGKIRYEEIKTLLGNT